MHPDQVQEELNRVVGSRQVRVEDRKNLPYTDAVIHESQRMANIVPMSLPHKTSRDVNYQGYFIKKVSHSSQSKFTHNCFWEIMFFELWRQFFLLSKILHVILSSFAYRGLLCFHCLLLSCMMRTNGRLHTLLTHPTSWIRRTNSSGETPLCLFLQVQQHYKIFLYRNVTTVKVWSSFGLLQFFILAGRRMCAGESLARMELFLFFTCLLQHFRFTPPPGVTEDELDLTPVVGFTLTPTPHELCAVSRHWRKKMRILDYFVFFLARARVGFLYLTNHKICH